MNGEILAFIVYFVAIVGVGIYFFFKEKGDATQANFFLGGRPVSYTHLTLPTIATV